MGKIKGSNISFEYSYFPSSCTYLHILNGHSITASTEF